MANDPPLLPKRPLGNTGLEVSVLGFGASPFGGAFGAVDEAVSVQSVHTAFRRGINFFDTSPFYGSTKSETVLGQALRDLPRSEIVVATKVGRYGNKPEDFDFSAARVTASVRESVERLQVPYVDLVQCHDIEFGDLDQIIRETLPALASLKAAGLVRHVGITGLPLPHLRYVLERAPQGSVETVLSYCHYCLLDTTLAAELPYYDTLGVGVINASALSMGLLTRVGPPAWHPAPPALRDAAAAAAAHAAARGWEIEALGLRFAFRNPAIASTLVGMFTPEQVHANADTALAATGLLPSLHDVPPGDGDGDGEGPLGGGGSKRDPDVEAQWLRGLFIDGGVADLTWPSGRPLPSNFGA